jgi:diaminohydroxyphosphoribosylaminopyrimidine deaminase/5-amino-6-(5-phosphoribosylamino)uracil reductase
VTQTQGAFGSGTIINDDPSLTCRLNGLTDRSPKRVILDRRLQISAKSNLIQTADKISTIIATKSKNEVLQPLQNQGVSILDLVNVREDQQLYYMVGELADRGISTLLVEGGAQIAKSFLDARLVDRLVIFQSNKNLVGINDTVKAPISPQNIDDFVLKNQLTFGSDIMYEYEPQNRVKNRAKG